MDLRRRLNSFIIAIAQINWFNKQVLLVRISILNLLNLIIFLNTLNSLNCGQFLFRCSKQRL